jgi:hypothetical protein
MVIGDVLKTSFTCIPSLSKLLLPFAALTVLTDEVTFAKTVTIAASNADQTAYIQAQVNSLANGDALVNFIGPVDQKKSLAPRWCCRSAYQKRASRRTETTLLQNGSICIA